MTWVLLSAFLVGILGSAHCFGMCGGIAATYSSLNNPHDTIQSAKFALSYNLGRMFSYCVAGLLAGAFSIALGRLIDIANWTFHLRLLSGALINLIGISLIYDWRSVHRLSAIGIPIWRVISPLIKFIQPGNTPARRFILGMIWGWLPCGMVYSMLTVALVSGHPFTGGLIMLSFAIGTLPSMLCTGVMLAKFHRRINKNKLKSVTGLLCLLAGVWIIAIPVFGEPGTAPQHPLSALSSMCF